jgi:hypothetical protein
VGGHAGEAAEGFVGGFDLFVVVVVECDSNVADVDSVFAGGRDRFGELA